MKTIHSNPILAAPADTLAYGANWAQELLKLQAAQWQMMMSWQDAMRSINQDWWEGWMCRWTGGLPIDG